MIPYQSCNSTFPKQFNDFTSHSITILKNYKLILLLYYKYILYKKIISFYRYYEGQFASISENNPEYVEDTPEVRVLDEAKKVQFS